MAASQDLIKSSASAGAFWPSLGRSLTFAILFLASTAIIFGSDALAPAAFGYACTYLWLCVVQNRRVVRDLAGMWTSPTYSLEVDEEGLSAKSEGGAFWRRWDRATRLLERDEYVMIAFDGLETLTIPTGCFRTAEAREAWLGYVRGLLPATALESSIR